MTHKTRYNHAHSAKPNRADTYNNRGLSLYHRGRYKEASASFDRAVAIAPEDAMASFNLAVTKLLLGNYEEGWRLYERRWQRTDRSSRTFSKPLWLGKESLAGKTILLHAEQGFGDTIQFCRYAALVAGRGPTVVLEVQQPLVSLISTLRVPCSVLPQGRSLPEFDFHCPLMSLPLAFGTSVDDVPAHIPYLYADGNNRRAWQQRLGKKSKIRVGLSWSGEANNPNDKHRSIPAHMLMPLLQHNCEYHSVQKGIKAEDADFLKSSNILPHDNQLNDFLDTASLLSEMDVIICVDTATAHLAGALGRPTWVMLPFAPDFRWLTEREDSPWYPTARLFRQAAPGDWNSVLIAVNDALASSVRATNNTLNLLERARTSHESGALHEAEATYRTILSDIPDQIEALTSLGGLLVQQNKTEEGMTLMEKAIRLEPEYASSYYNYGLALQMQNRHGDALAQYDKAIATDSNYAEAYNNRGIALHILGRHSDAVASFQKALAISPSYTGAARNLSLALSKLTSE